MEAKSILSFLLILFYYANADEVLFDITNYGATPQADINQALSKAWQEAIVSEIPSKIVIPMGTWELSQVTLEGPNSAPLELEIVGTIQDDPNDDGTKDEKHWITISHVDSFTISGGGTLDGKGQLAWKTNDCHKELDCKKLKRNLSLNFVSNSLITNLTSKDSKFFHISCHSCTGVQFTNVTVSAPGDSPNTDGINVIHSTSVIITDSVIGTGDDCISIDNDVRDIHIRNVVCGPGHGISIGSLGRTTDEKDVSGIFVKNCTFIGTKNGVRIKTWPSAPGTLRVSNVHYADLVMENASNPIMIDQYYCPSHLCDPKEPSLVEITGVTFENVTGSTSSEEAVTLRCSSAKPCEDIQFGDVTLSYTGTTTEIRMNSTCVNAYPTFHGIQFPPICDA